MQLCFLGAYDDTEPPALFPPNIQQVRHTRSDFLMLKENKQDSNFPFRKTNGLCYSSMVLFGQIETGNSELAFKEEKKTITQAWILQSCCCTAILTKTEEQ